MTEQRLSSNLRSSVDINNNSHPGKKEVDTNHEDEDKKGGSMRWTNPVRIGIRAFRKDNTKVLENSRKFLIYKFFIFFLFFFIFLLIFFDC